jgi:peptide/nickel transport system ATP-binding protein
VQAVFQDPYEVYNPFYKVDRVLELPIKNFKLASSGEEGRKLITEALDAVNLTAEEVLGKYPHQLSGGQRQRLMIARALLTRPRLIVADEPVSMVDASLRAGILNTMLNLKKAYGISFIFITHDLSVADYFSDDIIVLYRGSNVESGDIKKVLGRPAHPYLQLLVSSIPLPDPERRWKTRTMLKAEEITRRRGEGIGCKFYSRCPKALNVCANTRPSSVQIDKDHFVSCHLYSK